MLDTKENIEETVKSLHELAKELGITEEEINSPEYDYLDED